MTHTIFNCYMELLEERLYLIIQYTHLNLGLEHVEQPLVLAEPHLGHSLPILRQRVPLVYNNNNNNITANGSGLVWIK